MAVSLANLPGIVGVSQLQPSVQNYGPLMWPLGSLRLFGVSDQGVHVSGPGFKSGPSWIEVPKHAGLPEENVVTLVLRVRQAAPNGTQTMRVHKKASEVHGSARLAGTCQLANSRLDSSIVPDEALL